jgi:hypothetical protein
MHPLSLIEDVLKKHQERDFFVENIPVKKVESALAYYKIDREDILLGLIDATVFGSCEYGIAFTATGIYWNNSWTTTTSINRL